MTDDDLGLGPRPNFLDSMDYQTIWQDQATGRYRGSRVGRWSESGEDPEELRSMPYARYLKTTHWQILRKRALANADHRCFYCGKTERLEVHHLSYRRRGCEFDEDLIVLCGECHAIEHLSEAEVRRIP